MSTAITITELASVKERMLKLIDKDVLEREISFAMQAINSSEGLQKCSKESLQKSVYNIALTGLSLNPVLKYAYIIPRWNRNGTVAVLEPSYQGLIKLLTDTGSITAVYANIVYEGDDFEVSYGTSSEIIHKPRFKSKEIKLVYAVAVLSGSNFKQFEVMDIEEINAIRDKSESYKAFAADKVKSCIWVDHYGEMAKKTVIKRLFKYLPKTEKFEKAAQAIAISNEDYQPTDGQLDYLVTMIERTGYDDDTKAIMINKVYSGIKHAEYEAMRKDAEMNKIDAITSGMPYNQADIKEHINKLSDGQ